MSTYEPSFLVRVKLDKRSEKIAAENGMTPEQFCREAIRFFSRKCVHTQAQTHHPRSKEKTAAEQR